jgi:antitoxin FitA
MATIQIRGVPAKVHRIYQRRAAEAGMSLQEYVLAEIVRGAETRSPAELIAEVEEHVRIEGDGGFMRGSVAAAVRANRGSH